MFLFFRQYWFFSCDKKVEIINQLASYDFPWTMWTGYLYVRASGASNLLKPVFKSE